MPKRTWRDYVDDLPVEDRDKLLRVLLTYYIDDIGIDSDIRYSEPADDPSDPSDRSGECIFWAGSGESILDG